MLVVDQRALLFFNGRAERIAVQWSLRKQAVVVRGPRSD